MLQTIKDYIANMPDKDFATFYQEYVLSIQDKIVDNDAKLLESRWKGDKSTSEILAGITTLTEELNTL